MKKRTIFLTISIVLASPFWISLLLISGWLLVQYGVEENNIWMHYERGENQQSYAYKDYTGAISSYEKALGKYIKAREGGRLNFNTIENRRRGLKSLDENILSELCLLKLKVGDYNGAISDCTETIKFLNPNSSSLYLLTRGIAKQRSEDFIGAIEDLNIVEKRREEVAQTIEGKFPITFRPTNFLYISRGIAKKNLGDLKGACSDWKKYKEFLLRSSSYTSNEQKDYKYNMELLKDNCSE